MSGTKSLLLDSNIVIYLSQKVITIDSFAVIGDELFISDITYMETLGFPFASVEDKNFMITLLNQFSRVGLTESIIQQTIALKQNYKIKLPDAIIAASAQVRDMRLITRNLKDFEKFSIDVFNPMEK
jgi:toxin FitB